MPENYNPNYYSPEKHQHRFFYKSYTPQTTLTSLTDKNQNSSVHLTPPRESELDIDYVEEYEMTFNSNNATINDVTPRKIVV